MNPHAGMTLGSRYTLTDRIAAGGMGDVWRATDSVLGRDVAVKVMRNDASADPTFAERFRDEARHTAALSHQNIATVYDYGEDDGAAYLVMELVDGEPLSAMIARGPIPEDRVRAIIGQAALALAAAHAAGVVHRDVKPANILITPDGRAKLTDFGIARATDGASHTRTGEVLGTPQYLSPEQALGRGATGASDLYALGIIAQEMLTGRKPFDSGSPVATALAQVNDAPPALPDWVPTDLRRIVGQSLAKDPEERPTSAAAVAAALGMPVAGLAQISPATSVVHTGDTDPAGTQVIADVAPAGATAVMNQAYPVEPQDVAGYDPGYEDGVPQYDDPSYDEPQYPPGGDPAEPERRRRGIGLWWLPILVLLAAVGFFAWTYLSTSATAPPVVTVTTTLKPSSTSTSSAPTTIPPTRTTTTTTTTTTAPAAVQIKKSDFVGRPLDQAKA
ncbi:MAG: serine/threonine protein kinase, partial [Actinomycetota bacterium]|nr:serine/threonine protein kinase [Actinomycetota bacterium]